MSETPLVSVLMTAFNREKYIAAAIESVLASTFSDFELIVVDDVSSDRTLAIVREYAARDQRIRVYANEKNLGDYFNRNKAASYARGKYIKYLDSDDLIYPYGLAVFVDAMEQNPMAAVGIMSSTNQEDRPYPYQLSSLEAYTLNFYTKNIFGTGPSGLIFRTEAFRAVNGFSGQRYIGDTEINLRLAARYPVVELSSSLVWWRKHEQQEFISGVRSTGYIAVELPMYEAALRAPECPLKPAQADHILAYYRKTSARILLMVALKRRNPAVAWSLFRKLKLGIVDVFNAVFFLHKKITL